MTPNDEGRPAQAAPDHSIIVSAKDTRPWRAGDGYEQEGLLRLAAAYRLLAEMTCGHLAASTGMCDQVADLVARASRDLQEAHYARGRLHGPRAALGALRKGRA